MSFDRWEGFTFFQLVDFSLLRDGEGLMDERMSFRRFFSSQGGKGNQWDGGWELGRMIKIMRVVFFDGDVEDEERRLAIILTTITHMS